MATDRDYPAPSKQMCDFLIETLSRVSEYEIAETQGMARRLYDMFEGSKRWLHTNHIADTFPWLYQIGVIDYKSEWSTKGGYRVVVWRNVMPDQVAKRIGARQSVTAESAVRSKQQGEKKPKAEADAPADPRPDKPKEKTAKKKAKKSPKPVASASESAKKKKRKKCCDDPKIVKRVRHYQCDPRRQGCVSRDA